MKTRINERPDGWTVWIYNEDHLERAREELRGYLAAPDDPRYRSAIDSAKTIRRQEQRLDQKYRKNFRDAADLWAYPGVRKRPLTVALVVACLIVFFLHETGKNRAGVVRALRFSTTVVDAEGRRQSNGLNDIEHGEIWRLITPIFLHFGILHILFNASALSTLGTLIEVRRGSLRFAGLVLVTAIASNVGQYLYMERMEPGEPQLFGGISGVLCGLFGYIWMKGLYEPEQRMILHPNSVMFGLLWIAVCMTGVFGPIGNAAHVVGLVTGVAFGVLRY